MSARRVVQVALLVVVAATVGLLLRPGSDSGEEAAAGTAAKPAADATTAAVEAPFAAYYFHGNLRCPTCLSIEEQAAAAVRDGFARELASGELTWAAVNYDLPENAHFLQDFGLTHSTVVLVERADGATVRFERLDRVWELVHEPELFREYMLGEVGRWIRRES
jgi:hypothetical protein